MVKSVDKEEGAGAQGMKELNELLGIVDAEEIETGEVKKAPTGRELGEILARGRRKRVDEGERREVPRAAEIRKWLESVMREGGLADLDRRLRRRRK